MLFFGGVPQEQLDPGWLCSLQVMMETSFVVSLPHVRGAPHISLRRCWTILRWIDANYREHGPRLFSVDYDTMREIEGWESRARTELFEPILAMFRLCLSNSGPDDTCAEASQKLNELTARHEERLSSRDWLVGSEMSAADIAGAPLIWYGMVDDAYAQKYPFATFFQKHLELGEGRERTRAWVERVMAFDR